MRRENGDLVIIDFGLLKPVSAKHADCLLMSISVVDGKAVGVGTPRYSAPEQFGGGEVAPSADILYTRLAQSLMNASRGACRDAGRKSCGARQVLSRGSAIAMSRRSCMPFVHAIAPGICLWRQFPPRPSRLRRRPPFGALHRIGQKTARKCDFCWNVSTESMKRYRKCSSATSTDISA